MITGGSKNGKSALAEKIITSSNGKRVYVACMQPFGDEAHAAIERHREIRRDKCFETVEKYTDIHELELEKNCCALLECLGNLCANEMFSCYEKDPVSKIAAGIKKLSDKASLFVVVTSEVGDDGVLYSPETMEYVKALGELNRTIAKEADCVIEAVFGLPYVLKGELPPCF